MSSRDKYGKFKKKDFLHTAKAVRIGLCEKFGYTIMPFLIETSIQNGALMEFYHYGGASAIFYDYKRFKEVFGRYDFATQKAYAAAITAHEMRHYYQHRQMTCKRPKEPYQRLTIWREDEECGKRVFECDTLQEFVMQPLELDATLFGYVYGAKIFQVALLKLIASEEHLNALEGLYKEYVGETDEEFFGEKVRTALKMRENS